MIKAEALYTKLQKGKERFDGFRLTIGSEVFEPIPINFIRKSELPKLEELLKLSYEMGKNEGYTEGHANGLVDGFNIRS